MDQICMFTTLDAESRRSYSHSKHEISQTRPGWRRNEKSKAWNIDELFFDKSIVNLTYGTDATTSFFQSLLFLTTKPPLPPLPTSVPSFPSTATAYGNNSSSAQKILAQGRLNNQWNNNTNKHHLYKGG
ncbi:hypothetical protein D917_06500, partial [Trichinella nativa]